MDNFSLSTPGRITPDFVQSVLNLAREIGEEPLHVSYSAQGAGYEMETMFGDEEQVLRLAGDHPISFRVKVSSGQLYSAPHLGVRLESGIVTVTVETGYSEVAETLARRLFDMIPAPLAPSDWGTATVTIPDGPRPTMKVFIGHGGDDKWHAVRDIVDAAGYRTESFERDTRNGAHILGTVLDMVRSSDVAIIVMTGADSVDGHLRARENVVHELGVAHAALGPRNTVIMLEEGVSEPSNISGTDQLRFANGDIYSSKDRLLLLLQTLDGERGRQ